MDYHERYAEREPIGYKEERPRLPSFDNFVRGTGHAELALRSSPTLDKGFSSSPSDSLLTFGRSSLLFPPVTNGYHNHTDSVFRDEDAARYRPAVFDDHEQPLVEQTRRASLAIPCASRPQPRPSRSYSSTSLRATGHDIMTWQHGRVIFEEDVPGKGLCYVYDDGTICPKEINGDTVNPKWGTTKAGKPRKRLGQACNTCREKKIKCDPGYPKCSQCLRFNRECRFDTNSRQGHKSPKFRTCGDSPGAITAYSPKEFLPSRKSSIAPTEASTPTDAVHRTLSRSSNSVEDVMSPTMTETENSDAPTPSKRQKLSSGNDRFGNDGRHDTAIPHSKSLESNSLGFAPDVDPVSVDSKLAKHYINAYLVHANTQTIDMFPSQHFTQWATGNQNKSLHDKVMLYALMALGSVYSDDQNRANHRAIFKTIVYQELDDLELQPCLELIHTILFLSIVEFADGRDQRADNVLNKSVGAVSALQMNVELPPDDKTTAYGFSPSMYGECRRRTFFTLYCREIFGRLSRADPRTPHRNDEIFLQLPCSSELYEKDEIPKLPIFDHNTVLPKSLSASQYIAMASLSHLVQICSICSQIQYNAWRCQTSLRVAGKQIHDCAERDNLAAQLREWADKYNDGIRAREGRTSDSDEPRPNHTESAGARARKYTGLDFVFHYAHMELHRRVHHKSLTDKEISTHAKNATIHAIEALRLAQQVLDKGGTETRDYVFATSGPATTYGIFTAIDIITAAGKIQEILKPRSELMAAMYTGLELVEKLAQRWSIAGKVHAVIKERVQTVFNSALVAVNQRKTFFYCSDSMNPMMNDAFDLIYGTNRELYLRAGYASSASTIEDHEIYHIDTTRKAGMPQRPA